MHAGKRSLGIVNMQETIKNDSSGDFLRETVAYLDSQFNEIQSILDKGVSPDEYDRLLSLKGTLTTSVQALKALWDRYHV